MIIPNRSLLGLGTSTTASNTRMKTLHVDLLDTNTVHPLLTHYIYSIIENQIHNSHTTPTIYTIYLAYFEYIFFNKKISALFHAQTAFNEPSVGFFQQFLSFCLWYYYISLDLAKFKIIFRNKLVNIIEHDWRIEGRINVELEKIIFFSQEYLKWLEKVRKATKSFCSLWKQLSQKSTGTHIYIYIYNHIDYSKLILNGGEMYKELTGVKRLFEKLFNLNPNCLHVIITHALFLKEVAQDHIEAKGLYRMYSFIYIYIYI